MPEATAIPVSTKPCAHPGCPLLRTGPRYCNDHADAVKLYDRERNRSPFRKLYQSRRWAVTRHTVLAHDPLCQKCFRAPATECDHVERASSIIRNFGPNEFFNPARCQGLCHTCHSSKT